eukprot:1417873-Rhodomonas_salina.1
MVTLKPNAFSNSSNSLYYPATSSSSAGNLSRIRSGFLPFAPPISLPPPQRPLLPHDTFIFKFTVDAPRSLPPASLPPPLTSESPPPSDCPSSSSYSELDDDDSEEEEPSGSRGLVGFKILLAVGGQADWISDGA